MTNRLASIYDMMMHFPLDLAGIYIYKYLLNICVYIIIYYIPPEALGWHGVWAPLASYIIGVSPQPRRSEQSFLELLKTNHQRKKVHRLRITRSYSPYVTGFWFELVNQGAFAAWKVKNSENRLRDAQMVPDADFQEKHRFNPSPRVWTRECHIFLVKSEDFAVSWTGEVPIAPLIGCQPIMQQFVLPAEVIWQS